ncbi:hypothetical protein G7Z17_g6344 [Cylindrodendrum hubeiense]|uniref:Uncharacterized protein n=1 Tax=Cylindrodendrum hubeiense TaxID=595255 RepID=A0A9P5H983_9HYPO|nr:hypothetical protein G7Z17_g6344 [Cylindrodendrum hubeiense]
MGLHLPKWLKKRHTTKDAAIGDGAALKDATTPTSQPSSATQPTITISAAEPISGAAQIDLKSSGTPSKPTKSRTKKILSRPTPVQEEDEVLALSTSAELRRAELLLEARRKSAEEAKAKAKAKALERTEARARAKARAVTAAGYNNNNYNSNLPYANLYSDDNSGCGGDKSGGNSNSHTSSTVSHSNHSSNHSSYGGGYSSYSGNHSSSSGGHSSSYGGGSSSSYGGGGSSSYDSGGGGGSSSYD